MLNVCCCFDLLFLVLQVSEIVVWGRSMGAAAALMYAPRDPSIAGLILDSPFASLVQVAKELVSKGTFRIPRMVVGVVLRMIKRSVRKRAGFDMADLIPETQAGSCHMPAVFAAANSDRMIGPHHSRQIIEHYAGEATLVSFPGQHNSRRPAKYYLTVREFLLHVAQLDTQRDDTNGSVAGQLPDPPVGSLPPAPPQ